ncbi:hypothetical protein LINPERPRIM_LOCUS9711 [Linum perenne]
MNSQVSLIRSGRCSSSLSRSDTIVVHNDGVDDRLRFLEAGLVFRLDNLSGSLPDWKSFRRWFSNSWGIPSLSRILSLGDDLWLLCCSSKQEVSRILRLQRWEFPGHVILADAWFLGAGTSKVVSSRGFLWVSVSGIPLHLRSEAVFLEIAKRLDPSAVVDDFGCNLNEIRIRVSRDASLPVGFWLCFEETIFWLSVSALRPEEKSSSLRGRSKVRDSKGKRRRLPLSVRPARRFSSPESEVPLSVEAAIDVPKTMGSSSSKERVTDGDKALRMSQVRSQELMCTESVVEKAGGEEDLPFCHSSILVKPAAPATCKKLLASFWSGCGSSPRFSPAPNFSQEAGPLKISDDSQLCLHNGPGWSFRQASDKSIWASWDMSGYIPLSGGPELNFAGSFLCDPSGVATDSGSTPSLVSSGPPSGVQIQFLDPSRSEEVDAQVSSPSAPLDVPTEISVQLQPDVILPSTFSEVPFESPPGCFVERMEEVVTEIPVGQSQFCRGNEEALLSDLSVKVAHLLDIKSPSSGQVDSKLFSDTAIGVYSRRKKSRVELELQRVHCSLLPPNSGGSRRKGEDVDASSSHDLS